MSRTGYLWRVDNPAALAELVRAAIANQHPQQTNAIVARRIGITPSTLSRLCNGRLPGVSQPTLEAIIGLCGDDAALRACFVGDAARERQAQYGGWVTAAWIRLARSIDPAYVKAKGPHVDRAYIEAKEQRRELFDRTARRRVDAFVQTTLMNAAPSQWDVFATFIGARPWLTRDRVRLALYRVFSNATGDPYGVERTWDDLSARERERIVTAALTIERTLLDRETDLRRAIDASNRDVIGADLTLEN